MQNGSRVLLVDDNDDDVLFVQMALKRAGVCSPLHFRRGQEAIDYLIAERGGSRTRAKLMLVDLVLPGLDGFRVIEKVRSNRLWDGIAIAVFTGTESPEKMSKAYELGANCFVPKPFQLEQCYRAIAGLVRFYLESPAVPETTKIGL